jgi:hypothetical protein
VPEENEQGTNARILAVIEEAEKLLKDIGYISEKI